MGPVIDKIYSENSSLFSLTKIDVDENTAMAKLYDIRSVPTFIFLKDGNVANRHTGAVSKDQFLTMVKSV